MRNGHRPQLVVMAVTPRVVTTAGIGVMAGEGEEVVALATIHRQGEEEAIRFPHVVVVATVGMTGTEAEEGGSSTTSEAGVGVKQEEVEEGERGGLATPGIEMVMIVNVGCPKADRIMMTVPLVVIGPDHVMRAATTRAIVVIGVNQIVIIIAINIVITQTEIGDQGIMTAGTESERRRRVAIVVTADRTRQIAASTEISRLWSCTDEILRQDRRRKTGHLAAIRRHRPTDTTGQERGLLRRSVES